MTSLFVSCPMVRTRPPVATHRGTHAGHAVTPTGCTWCPGNTVGERTGAHAEAGGDHLGQDVPVVGPAGDVAPVEHVGVQVLPRPVHGPAGQPASEQQHDTTVAVVGAGVGVLLDPPAELAHHHHRDVVEPVAEILREGGQRLAELRELCLHRSAVDRAEVGVHVPAADVHARHAHTDVGLDQAARARRAARGSRRRGRSPPWAPAAAHQGGGGETVEGRRRRRRRGDGRAPCRGRDSASVVSVAISPSGPPSLNPSRLVSDRDGWSPASARGDGRAHGQAAERGAGAQVVDHAGRAIPRTCPVDEPPRSRQSCAWKWLRDTSGVDTPWTTANWPAAPQRVEGRERGVEAEAPVERQQGRRRAPRCRGRASARCGSPAGTTADSPSRPPRRNTTTSGARRAGLAERARAP